MTDDARIVTRRRALALMGAAGLVVAVAAACTTGSPREQATASGAAWGSGASVGSGHATGGSESTLTVAPNGGGYVGTITMGVRTD